MRRRLLMVARGRYTLPLDESLRRKFDALSELLDVRVLASSSGAADTGDPRFHLFPPLRPRFLDGAAFYLALPFRTARELRAFGPDAVLVQGAHEAAAVLLGRRLAGRRPTIILDVHGDWRTATRLYGSPLRRLLDPLADAVARIAVRRVDAVRSITGFTTGLLADVGRVPTAEFPAFMDLSAFAGPPVPLPEPPQALFVGVLERYKNIDGLVAAWRLAAPRVRGAVLHIVGSGTRTDLVQRLVAELPAATRWTPRLSTAEVAAAFDEATALVLPSRSEGMGRVIVESFCRGRPVIGAAVGGIPELVEDGVNGLLADPDDVAALADAIVRVLGDRALAEALAAGAEASAAPWLASPSEYASRVSELVDRATTSATG